MNFTKGDGATNTVIVRGDNNYPITISDGVLVDNTTGTSVTDINQNSEIATKYYSAWSYSTVSSQYSTNYSTTLNGGIVMSNTILIGLILFAMLTFLALAYTFKKPVFLWFSAVLSLIWSILMNLNTNLFPTANYIWIVIGAMFFISFAFLTRTINDNKKVAYQMI